MARTQGWIETADIDLYGRNGDKGVIREHRDDRAERDATQKFIRRMFRLVAIFSSIPALIEIGRMIGLIHN